MMEKLTLEERIARAARSQASSPEAAARLVQQLAQTETARLFASGADFELMCGLLGDFMNSLEEDLMHYSGFCRSFYLAIDSDFPLVPQTEPTAVYHPALGARVSNAVVLLGLMLLDHARDREWDKEIYHCTRMTLGQYLDALSALVHPGDEPADQRFRLWRDLFLAGADPSAPLAEVLADDLRRYLAGWRMLGRLDHILDCMYGLSSYLEEERTAELDRALREAMRQAVSDMGVPNVEVVEEDEREQYPDPCGRFLAQARDWSGDVPDPGAKDTAAGAVRDQLFLSQWDYSPASLEAKSEDAPTPEFQALLEEQIDPRRLKNAMAEINTAVVNLFMLWVEPYLWMEERPQ